MARKTAITEPRHHSAHPPSSVAPNLAINKAPNVAASPNVNPSLGPVGTTPLDTVNSRKFAAPGDVHAYGQPDPALRPLGLRNGDGLECDDPEEEPNINGDCPEDVERSHKVS